MEEIRTLLRDNFEDFFVEAFARTHPDTDLDFEPYLQHVLFVYQNLKKGARVVINQPPRSLKTWTAKFYVAWCIGRRPSLEVMAIANTQRLAEEFTYDVRRILLSKWYRKIFPKTRILTNKSSVSHFKTSRYGCVFAGSMGSSVAGFGADLLVIDDGNKISDSGKFKRLQEDNESFDSEIYSRLNNRRKAKVINIQHRIDENDLSGHLLAEGYKSVALPLIAPRTKKYKIRDDRYWTRTAGDILIPSQYSKKEIERAKRTEKPPFFWFYQQGQGKNKLAPFKFAHFKLTNEVQFIGPAVVSIDTAARKTSTSSFNVVQVWRQTTNGYHLLDQFRAQCSYIDLEDAARRLIRRYRPAAVLIENTANGGPLLSRLTKRLPKLQMHAIEPKESKTVRLDRHRKTICSGKISVQPDSEFAAAFIEEFVDHPNGPTDQIDGATQYLDFMSSKPILTVREPGALAQAVGANGMRLINDHPLTNHRSSNLGAGQGGRAFAGTAFGSQFRKFH